jgi:hypothetical protein
MYYCLEFILISFYISSYNLRQNLDDFYSLINVFLLFLNNRELLGYHSALVDRMVMDIKYESVLTYRLDCPPWF